jgi:hypothetical protein
MLMVIVMICEFTNVLDNSKKANYRQALKRRRYETHISPCRDIEKYR